MLNFLIDLLKNLPPWAILSALIGIMLYFILLLSNRTFLLPIAFFVIAQSFATAEQLRISVPLLGYLPALMASMILIVLVFKHRPVQFSLMGWCWFVIVLWFAFRLAIGLYGDRAITYGLYYLIISMMALLVGYHITVSENLERFFKVIAITGAIIALILMADFFISGLKGAFRTGRLASYGLQANILGPTCAVLALYSLGYFLISTFEKMKLWRITMFFITVTTALLTFSRSTIFPLVAGILLILLFGRMKFFKIVFLSVIVLLGLYFIFIFMLSKGYLQGSQWERVFTPSISGREVYFEDIWENNIKNNFMLGQGFFGAEMGGGTLKHGDPHNSYLNLLVEQGLLGLMIVLFFNVIVLISTLRYWRSQFMSTTEIFILRLSFASILVYLAVAMAVPNLWLHNTLMAFDLMAKTGILLGFKQIVRLRTVEYYEVQDYSELIETQI